MQNAGTPNHPNPSAVKTTGPCTAVIFGASGDLTKRKLVPALYNLAVSNYLNRDFALVGFARPPMSHQDFRDKLNAEISGYAGAPVDKDVWAWFLERIYYMSGEFSDPAAYQKLKTLLTEVEERHNTQGNRFYYLATLPSFFGQVVEQLGAAGLVEEKGEQWRRVIIEKPFGRDLESARALNRDISKVLAERQIYRIDHYLGKETVQNIMALRFGNGIFEPIWNRRYVDHVQITVAEELGVEQRGPYYEEAGALRDMVPNHILQLIALTAMEPPISFDADAVRDEKHKVLKAISPMSPEEVLQRAVRGQYGEGVVADTLVRGYRKEDRVSQDSNIETFVALKLYVDNWRWAKVPFYLRTGKRLPKRVTEIAIQFHRPPLPLFRHLGMEQVEPNVLVVRIQPNEGITLTFGAKVPGPNMDLGSVNMDFNYADYFGVQTSTGYETLLYECIMGDATPFQRADMLEAGWSVVQPILDVWKALPPRDFPNYASGSWGPREADALLERDGCHWRHLS
ncbi:MAG TPA: glucose-6-phosphate dehydrogenase [bacterium]|jgi:glucose-6-phosphate 1-dehydrogenase|nr:glucose-6-phosphate dehydrogenase [bacterium]